MSGLNFVGFCCWNAGFGRDFHSDGNAASGTKVLKLIFGKVREKQVV